MPSSVAFVDHATLPLFVPDEQGFPPVVLYRIVFTRGLGSKFGAALSQNSTGTEWGAAGGVFSVNVTIPSLSPAIVASPRYCTVRISLRKRALSTREPSAGVVRMVRHRHHRDVLESFRWR